MNDDDRNIAQRHRFGGNRHTDDNEQGRAGDLMVAVVIGALAALVWHHLRTDRVVFFNPPAGHNAQLRGAIVLLAGPPTCRPLPQRSVGSVCRTVHS